MQRPVLVVSAVVLASVLVGAGYWLVQGTAPAAARAAAPPSAPRETPVFLREPEPTTAPAETPRAEVEPAAPKAIAPTPVAPASEGVILGRFVDRVGRPVAAVHVASPFPVLAADSDEHGRFELRCPLTAGSRELRLSATRAGFVKLELRATASADAPVDLGDLVLTAGGAVSGRVLDEFNRPFANAEVRVATVDVVVHGPAYHGPWKSKAEGASDDAGNFRITDAPTGMVRVWAGADEHLWATSEALEVTEGGEVFGVELVVRRIARESLIQLTVVDPQGEPVPRAHIAYVGASGGSSWSGSSQADEHGRYTHYVQTRAPHDFRASDPEGRYRPAVANAVAPGTLDLVLRLAVSRRLQLVVRDVEGEPVARFKAVIELRRGGSSVSETLVADGEHADGRAEFELPVESFEFSVDAVGYDLAKLGPLEPDALGAELLVTLTALPGVRGGVVAGGQALAGARVTLHAEVDAQQEHIVNGFPARSRRSVDQPVTTDDDGAFLLTLRSAGRYFVRAVADGWAPGESGPLELQPATGASGLSIELVRGGSVAGRALAGANESPANLIIGASRGDAYGQTTRTDAEGNFRFDGLTPGRWWIGRHDREVAGSGTSSQTGTAEHPVEIPWNCVVRDGETTRFDVALPPEDLVHLQGFVALGGKPAAGWRVNLSPQGQGRNPGRQATIDLRGRFEIGAREPGEFYLSLDPDSSAGEVRVWARLELRAGGNDFELDLPVGRVEGQVALVDFASHAFTWNWNGREGVQMQGSFTPAEDGRFVLERVPAGRVVLSRVAATDSERVRLAELDVQPGVTTRVP